MCPDTRLKKGLFTHESHNAAEGTATGTELESQEHVGKHIHMAMDGLQCTLRFCSTQACALLVLWQHFQIS